MKSQMKLNGQLCAPTALASGTNLIEGWMGSRTDLDHVNGRFWFSSNASHAKMEEHNLEMRS